MTKTEAVDKLAAARTYIEDVMDEYPGLSSTYLDTAWNKIFDAEHRLSLEVKYENQNQPA